MKNKVEKLTGRVSELITFEAAGHGDPKIKSTENVINNLHFMDEILYNGNNPYRNTNYLI